MGTLHLIEGPAGSGKSQIAEHMVRTNKRAILSDYTAEWAASRAVERDPKTGRYPIRAADDAYNEVGPYIKKAKTRIALRNGLDAVVTSATKGMADSYRELVQELQAAGYSVDFSLTTVDPGKAQAVENLLNSVGELTEACEDALGRWYG